MQHYVFHGCMFAVTHSGLYTDFKLHVQTKEVNVKMEGLLCWWTTDGVILVMWMWRSISAPRYWTTCCSSFGIKGWICIHERNVKFMNSLILLSIKALKTDKQDDFLACSVFVLVFLTWLTSLAVVLEMPCSADRWTLGLHVRWDWRQSSCLWSKQHVELCN